MGVFKVERIEAEKFSKIWNKGGITLLLPPESIDFAADFANVVLNNFIAMCEAKAAEEAAKRFNKKPLIIEGVK